MLIRGKKFSLKTKVMARVYSLPGKINNLNDNFRLSPGETITAANAFLTLNPRCKECTSKVEKQGGSRN